MAYTETYKVEYKNEQSQTVIATIYKKDGPVVTIENYKIVSLELNDRSEGQTKYESTIISRELTLTLWSEDSDSITWETFITAEHDDWKIDVKIDGQLYFEGFITPDEGNSPFQDKPYEVTFRATNGLALLKGVSLVNVDGDNFTGINRIIDYIAGALMQTGLSLPIRVYCNYFNGFMDDRAVNIDNDMFYQGYLEYRTFLQSPVKFVNCYDALMIILDKFCRLEYWNGYWLIKNIAELQFSPGPNNYTDYGPLGNRVAGSEDTTNQYQIGKAVDIYPINEDQQIYSRFAIKSNKTTFNYSVWPELPTNNKFERGTQFETGDEPDSEDIDGDGDTSEIIGTYKKFTIDNWEYGRVNILDFPHPAMSDNGKKFYKKTVTNTLGSEIQTVIGCETDDVVDDTQFWMRSEAIPVQFGDKIKVGWQKRFDNNFVGSADAASVGAVYIVSDDNSKVVTLSNTAVGSTFANGVWIDGSDPVFGLFSRILLTFSTGQDSSKWNSVDVNSPAIPFSGNMYIVFACESNSFDADTNQYWKDFSFEYLPYLAGGFIPVKGDYWERSQNKVYPDTAEEEVKISDSPKKVLKGALLLSDGSLTQTVWYRYPRHESRHFKELLNIARFNHSYRRMYALDGSFNGLNCAAENDQLHKFPIRFDKTYRLVDLADPREFVLVPPLKMDLVKGWITASLVEVRRVADGSVDGDQFGDDSSFKYLFDK